jgi:ABC-type nitrate/sulfonate/bicarbonate transport system substrate-binding protein
MFSRRQFIGSVAATTATLPLTACFNLKSTKLKVGYVKVLAALPFMFAQKMGHFAKAGLEIEAIEFANSNDVATAGVTRAVDFIGAGATNACLDAMTASGTTMEIFTTNNYVRRPNKQSTDFLLSLPDFKTIESLKGQPVAFFPGSFGKMFAKLVLPKLGLDVSDVEYVEMQPGQWLAALQSGAIKAVTALEPAATKIMATLPVNVLVDGYYASVMQNVPASGSWFRAGHLDQSTEAKINRVMLDAITTLSGDRAAATTAIETLFSLDRVLAAQVRMLDWQSAKAANNRASLKQFASLLESAGGIARPVPKSDAWIWS